MKSVRRLSCKVGWNPVWCWKNNNIQNNSNTTNNFVNNNVNNNYVATSGNVNRTYVDNNKPKKMTVSIKIGPEFKIAFLIVVILLVFIFLLPMISDLLR